MDYQNDPVFDQAPIIHKFEVVEGSDDVPQCALECRPKEKINPKLCLYQFFAMVDDNFSTVAFGKNETCFHVAFKPDDWDQVKRQYPVGTVLRLEMYPIGPEVSSGEGPETSYAGKTPSIARSENRAWIHQKLNEHGTPSNSGTYGTNPLENGAQPVQEAVDIDGLKGLINEIVDEMTEPISQRMDQNKVMIEEILSNQTERYESLPKMIQQEIEEQNRHEGATIPNDTQTADGGCKCIIS